MNVVVIPHIKSKQPIVRGKLPPRKGTDWIKYSFNTWKWWCTKNNVQFEILETNCGGLEDLPYTYQRWCAVSELFKKYGDDAKLAFVDGDTMVKWDAPNFFDMCPSDSLTVTARENSTPWCENSIKIYQPLFPDVELPMKNYYNTGFIIFTKSQLSFIENFIKFAENSKKDLLDIQLAHNVGSDQTPFNFMLRKMGNKVNELPVIYNWLFPFWNVKKVEEIYMDSEFDFIEKANVWHFAANFRFRDIIMSETWKRVSHHYQ